jgi:hypothetical protein
VLIVRDVLGWSAEETASALDLTVPAANSALQRARATLRDRLPARRAEWTATGDPTEQERELLARLIDAHERQDVAASVALMREDIRVTMPPYPWRYDGLATFVPLLERAFGPESDGDWRLLPTRANRQPATASYLREQGGTQYRAFKLDVMRIEEASSRSSPPSAPPCSPRSACRPLSRSSWRYAPSTGTVCGVHPADRRDPYHASRRRTTGSPDRWRDPPTSTCRQETP